MKTKSGKWKTPSGTSPIRDLTSEVEKKQLEQEIKTLILKRDMHLLESKTAYFLFNRNNAKVAYNNCLNELRIKRAELKSL